jgi:hypothetical protein
MHLHSVQVKEQSLLELKINHHNTVMRESLLRAFDILDNYIDGVRDTYYTKSLDYSNETGYFFLKGYINPAMPLLSSLSIYDDKGKLLANTLSYPPKDVEVNDRAYFKLAMTGQKVLYYGPYMGRTNNSWSYSTIRRLEAKDGSFKGVLVASVEASYFAGFCKDISPITENDVSTYITNSDNKIIIQCNNTDMASEYTSKDFYEYITKNQFKDITISTLSNRYESEDLILFSSKLPNYSELRIFTITPKGKVEHNIKAMAVESKLLELIILLGELVCFSMYWNALVKERD